MCSDLADQSMAYQENELSVAEIDSPTKFFAPTSLAKERDNDGGVINHDLVRSLVLFKLGQAHFLDERYIPTRTTLPYFL